MPKPLTQSAKRKSTSMVNFNLRRSISKPNIESFKTHRKIEEAPELEGGAADAVEQKLELKSKPAPEHKKDIKKEHKRSSGASPRSS